MGRSYLLAIAMLTLLVTGTARAEPVPVRHIQLPMHRFMVARSQDGRTIASGEFSQSVQGNEVTMRLTYRFLDGSIDDEVTTYTQQGTFHLVRNHHLEKGPYFTRPIDVTIDDATGTVTNRTTDKNGNVHVDTRHMDLPVDLSNGFVGTLLLNVPAHTPPFRVWMLVPVGGGRLVQLQISPESEQTVQLAGQTYKAAVFRVHPMLGGFVSLIARLMGIQPRDVVVWVIEGNDPAVAVVIGQLGGYGPVISSDLIGSQPEQ